ncbi:MAG: baseplate J/gp47 family protein [Patescibacteria group bacterium]
MPGTKILNVQKSDSFDEVFEAFTQAVATEVIFIFPKGSPIAQEPAYFEAIKQEAERSGKTVNVMTTDPLVAHLASQNGLGLLQSPAPKQRRATVVAAPTPQPEPEPPTSEAVGAPTESVGAESAPEYPMAQEAIADVDSFTSGLMADLAVARKTKPKPTVTPSGKPIRDIVTQEKEAPMDIVEAPEEHVELPISRASLIPKAPLESAPSIEQLWEQEERHQEADPVVADAPKRKLFGKISKKFIFIPAGLAVVALGIILYITVGHAEITLTPHTEPLDLKLKITASPKTETVNAEFSKIPGQEFTVQKETQGSYELTTTKEVAQNATGKITITNKSANTQRLVATTRFESPDGFVFRIRETISVPAGGSIDSAVYADRPGKEYNIAATKFTLPGLKGTPQYTTITAASTAAMTGGFIGNAKIVTEQDFAKAQEELTKQAKELVTQALKEQAGDLKFTEDSTITVANPVVNAKAGEAAEKLEMKISASASVIAYRESDVKALLQHFLDNNGNLELVEKGLTIAYANIKHDSAAKTLSFDIQATGKAATKIDTAKIFAEIKGMNQEALEKYFDKHPTVSKANIRLTPIWVFSVPKDEKKVEFTVDR